MATDNNAAQGKPGILAQKEIPATADMKRIVLGPFRRDEVPTLQIRRENVEPKGSLICQKARLDEDNGYRLVYLFQNYGMKTVRVTIRRTR